MRRAIALLLVLAAAAPGRAAVASDERLPARPEQLWRIEAGAPVRAAPVAGGGRIYVLSERGDLTAASPAGKVLWQSRLASAAGEGGAARGVSFAAPPLYLAGVVVAGDRDGTVHALDAATGRPRWQARVAGGILGTPTFAPPERGAPAEILVLAQADGRVVRFDLASGRERGASSPTNRCDGSAAVADGTLVFGNCDAALHFFDAGSLRPLGRLDLERDGQVSAGVAIAGGVVFAGDRLGRLTAADLATRRTLWVNRDAAGAVTSTPAARGELVVFSSDDGGVQALEAGSGRRRWRRETGGRPGSPLLDAGGKVAVAARGVLFVLDARDGAVLWSREISDEITDPALAEGRLLVGTDDGALVAFGAGRGGLP